MRAATLAVGTEVTDGQIHDLNSGWISERLVDSGIRVIEHRAVADDRADIERALLELSSRVDLLFVTGGLGPTSDDFTRELIAKITGRSLEYHDPSWQHVSDLLRSRGLEAREIQRQQCFFPKGSQVFKNPAGTANAFSLTSDSSKFPCKVFALPGPPAEIAAVWEAHIASEIDTLVPPESRDEMILLRCLGRGESQVAEPVEDLIRGSGLKVGYRANLPYVEVKFWFKRADRARYAQTLAAVESALAPWIVSRGQEDAADHLIEISQRMPVAVQDLATGGRLFERVRERLRARKLDEKFPSLRIETSFAGGVLPPAGFFQETGCFMVLSANSATNEWRITLRSTHGPELALSEQPPFKYQVLSERGRRYITEKFLISLKRFSESAT